MVYEQGPAFSPEVRPSHIARRARDLFLCVYPQIRVLAARSLSQERRDHTLQPTALTHEVFVRLVGSRQVWESEEAFLGAVAQTIRRVLVDHARAHLSEKRFKPRELRDLWNLEDTTGRWQEDFLDVDTCLTKLKNKSERQARIAELKLFAGMTNEEIAEALGIARSTVAEDWAIGRAWLSRALTGTRADE
jgi:RNA polymerase sigma-70 factor, ECF subfamily